MMVKKLQGTLFALTCSRKYRVAFTSPTSGRSIAVRLPTPAGLPIDLHLLDLVPRRELYKKKGKSVPRNGKSSALLIALYAPPSQKAGVREAHRDCHSQPLLCRDTNMRRALSLLRQRKHFATASVAAALRRQKVPRSLPPRSFAPAYPCRHRGTKNWCRRESPHFTQCENPRPH